MPRRLEPLASVVGSVRSRRYRLGKPNSQILRIHSSEMLLTKIGGWLDPTIFYGVLVLIVLTAIPFGTVDPWWESIFECAVFGLAILWLVDGLLCNSWGGREHLLLLPLLAIAVFAIIQILPFGTVEVASGLGELQVKRTISVAPFETWRFFQKLVALTLAFGLLLRYVSAERRLRILTYVTISIGIASAAFGLLKSEMPTRWLALAGERLSLPESFGQFENRNHFALLMEMSIGLLIGLTVADRSNKKRLIVYLFFGVILWAALLLTRSRGGVLSLLFEIPFFFLLYSTVHHISESVQNKRGLFTEKLWRAPRLIAMIAVVSLIIVSIAASVIFIGGDVMIRRLERTPEEFVARDDGSPKLNRPQIWKGTLELIKDHPIVGVGFGGYSVAIPRYVNAFGDWTPEQAHNDYLELLGNGGLLAAGLVIWFLAIFVRRMKCRLLETSGFQQALICGALSGLFAVAVHSFFDFGLHITINSLVCAILIVIAIKAVPPPQFSTAR